MTATPTIMKPAPHRPMPPKPGLDGRTVSALLLALAVPLLLLPFIIVKGTHEFSDVRGGPGSVAFTITAPSIPGRLDLVLLLDRSTSYADDIPNMAAVLPEAIETIAKDSDLRFGIASFIDGTPTDPDFEINRDLTGDLTGIEAALRGIDVGSPNNRDTPERSLAALQRTLTDFSFRAEAEVVVLLATDAASKEAPGQTAAEVASQYLRNSVRIVVALVPEGSATEYDVLVEQAEELARGSNGSLQQLDSRDSSGLGDAVLAGVGTIPVRLSAQLLDGCPVSIGSFDPPEIRRAAGGQRYDFRIDYVVAPDAPAGISRCTVDFGSAGTEVFSLNIAESDS